MLEAAEALWNALHGHSPVVVVLYGDLGLLERGLAEVESLADPEWSIFRVHDVDQALAAPVNSLALLVPEDEAKAIRRLEANRERFLDREVPVVVFLRRGGEGEDALDHAPSIAGWVSGNAVDPERLAEIDPEAERDAFLREVGMTPEEWLARHRGEGLLDTRSLGIHYRALLLER